MINCNIRPLVALCEQLMLEQNLRDEGVVGGRFGPIDEPISDAEKARMEGWIKVATTVANEFEWKAVHDRICVIQRKLGKPLSRRDLATELRVLRETINSGLKWQLVYRYPQEKSDLLTGWKERWASVLKAFPSAESDILAGIDLWALAHSTASVFHFMRVLEHGLRALAADVGKNFDIQNWQNIINEIEAEIRAQGKAMPPGTAKSERLQFLSESAKEVVYFKDGWRNYVSHGRGAYDEHQARSVLEHVKSFMMILATKLSEADVSLEQSS